MAVVSPAESLPTPKAERTRAAIITAALDLFRENGYDATTMRAIAERAGVSVGNAYYYFDSKEHLIQAFYDRAGDSVRAAAAPGLANAGDLADCLRIYMHTWIDEMEPFRAFAGTFFKNAADPTSALSPFSSDSAPARQAQIEQYAELAAISSTTIPDDVADELPGLLWLWSMGIVLFWVHDRSADAARTRLLVTRTATLVRQAVDLAGLPMLKATITDLIGLISELRDV
jgi:AcrR family transcriptional regulator